jgi:hypothetical protein
MRHAHEPTIGALEEDTAVDVVPDVQPKGGQHSTASIFLLAAVEPV